jgi:hypothetical protein
MYSITCIVVFSINVETNIRETTANNNKISKGNFFCGFIRVVNLIAILFF